MRALQNKPAFVRLLAAGGILALSFGAMLLFDIGCLIKRTFGIPCPGCGMTRACLYFLQGDIQGALYWHPLFWLVPPLLLAAVWTQGRVFHTLRANTLLWAGILVLFLAVYLIRMLTLFPDTPPMDYWEGNLIARLLGWG